MACVSLHICRQLLPHRHAPALCTFHCPQESSGYLLPDMRFVPCVRVLHVNLTMSHCVSFQGGLLLKVWQKAMSTEAGRKMGRKLIKDLALSQNFDPVGIYNDLKGADLTALTFLRKRSSNID